jgi:hypothetical protein
MRRSNPVAGEELKETWNLEIIPLRGLLEI